MMIAMIFMIFMMIAMIDDHDYEDCNILPALFGTLPGDHDCNDGYHVDYYI